MKILFAERLTPFCPVQSLIDGKAFGFIVIGQDIRGDAGNLSDDSFNRRTETYLYATRPASTAPFVADDFPVLGEENDGMWSKQFLQSPTTPEPLAVAESDHITRRVDIR